MSFVQVTYYTNETGREKELLLNCDHIVKIEDYDDHSLVLLSTDDEIEILENSYDIMSLLYGLEQTEDED